MPYTWIEDFEIKNEDGIITVSSLIAALQKVMEKKGDLHVKGSYDNGIWERVTLEILKNDTTDEELSVISINE